MDKHWECCKTADMIDRSDFRQAFECVFRGKLDGMSAQDVTRRLRRLLKDFPAVDAVPAVHRRWVEKGSDLVCSGCGAGYDFEVLLLYRGRCDPLIYAGFEHCPHCGAKMDGDA